MSLCTRNSSFINPESEVKEPFVRVPLGALPSIIHQYSIRIRLLYGNGSQGRLGIWKPETLRDTGAVPGNLFTQYVREKQYELKDHLGNVRVVISDLKLTPG